MKAALKVGRVTPKQVRELRVIYKTSENSRERGRAQAVLLSKDGKTAGDIADIIKTSDDFVRRAIHRFEKGGSEGLREGLRSGRASKVTPEMDKTLSEWVKEQEPSKAGVDRSYWTAGSLAEALNKKYRIDVGEDCVRLHLIRLEMVCRRPTWTLKPLATGQPGYRSKKRG
jgi:transposase